ncbi:(2,3-dihydroxybenzoyl)adenylate synthase [Pseudoroseicyclus aestuarii]|uniref:2,3-dihydroxybenzoate-AMP ligase n=1 Tax=Pseudoroseicyclus aestuarii TaxID=1795041 RepID=A0A318ST24_9RHOB|nr:AMP-binding protein [Pseudoroseicyclus aestuarii]PYE84485.1 2,3-dihydroxybenzoate-AMP ligase [Pseudoroseicyclus aestuarii]
MTEPAPPQQIWPEDRAARYRAAGYWTGETFPALLRDRAARHATRTAVIGGEMRLSYEDLLEDARRIGAGFLALGLRPGDRVVLQLPNEPAFVQVMFGLFMAGLLPVFALPAHRRTEIAHFAARSGAKALVVADRRGGFDYRAMAREVSAEVGLAHVVVAGEAEEFVPLGSLSGDPGLLPPDPEPSSVAFLQISGGSTGLSKLIPRTHDDYLYSVRESATICGLTEASVYLAALPAAHNFTLSSPGVLGALHAGGTVVLAPDPNPQTAFPLIARHGVTMSALVPPLALLWLDAAAARGRDELESLTDLLVGGARLPPEAARRIGPGLGCRLTQVFGMAEGLVNYTRAEDPDEIVTGTQGRPISPDDEIRLVDDQDREVPEGTPGQLLTRGPYTITAYHGAPEANARSFTADGFYRTGDVVLRLPSGHLVVQGRATDHINRAGEKVSAEEIEDHLLGHEGVYDAICVSIPDAELGERSCAFVIRRDPALRGPQVKTWMRGRGIASFKIPDEVRFVEAFETTAALKISRRQLRARLRAAALEGESDADI